MNTKVGKRKREQVEANLLELTYKGRPAIPEPMKRNIRQRCGFGCVVCGEPLYEYEHITDYAEIKKHVESDITLLCDKHHKEVTNGLLAKDTVREANAAPFNMRGYSKPYFYHDQKASLCLNLGGNFFFYDQRNLGQSMIIFIIDSEPILWFTYRDGNLLLNLTFYDHQNNRILIIRDNELVYSIDPWDIAFIGRKLSIRMAPRNIVLELKVSPNEQKIEIENALFCFNGYEVVASADRLGLKDSFGGISRCQFLGSSRLLSFGGKPSAPFHVSGDRTYRVG